MISMIIVLALLATVSALGLGLLSMEIWSLLDKDFGERFVRIRVALQGIAVLLVLTALY